MQSETTEKHLVGNSQSLELEEIESSSEDEAIDCRYVYPLYYVCLSIYYIVVVVHVNA